MRVLPITLGLISSLLSLGSPLHADGADESAAERVVIPFDFESEFDDGRYGSMVGDLIWKKLERSGGFIIPESMLEQVIEVASKAANTGKIGDGKIFVYELEQAVRIRTGETGEEAL